MDLEIEPRAEKQHRWWWSTLCSKHQDPDPQGCRLCRAGWWVCTAHNTENCEVCAAAEDN